ncbi:mechanosensitive ion channel family protein [Ancylobacter amanitiformis]|uniref:Small-conductance mechanosensitive channel n=1 Tax=Ancylobacter amanitiformis TaxID=217069 RepID=A0ABU0LMB4_9HYPH|nr:mechanosensitive ion channel family protein [Ancylobacter amanitiformis]MDQ0509821.1 small-conductance mechanosensitive channel [Ancylobacter amanitiformis]
MTFLSRLSLHLLSALLALALWAMPAIAQTAPSTTAPPAPLSQQQFDQLVDSLAKAVSERLQAQPGEPAHAAAGKAATETSGTATSASGKAAPAAPAASAPMMDMANEEPLSEMLIEVIERGDDALEQFPALIAQGARIPTILGPELNSGRDPNRFLLLLLGCVAAALATELLLRLALKPARHYLARRVEGAASIWALAALVSLDMVVLTGMWLVTHGFVVGLFSGTEPQDKFGFLVLTSVFYWRLYLLIFRIALRPNLPQARLAEIDTAGARKIYRWASLVIAVAITLGDIRRILEGMHSSPLVVACAVLVNTLLLTSLLVAAAAAVREPVALWFHGLSQQGRPGPLVRTIARLWLVIAIPLFLALGMARIYGALTSVGSIHLAILMTMDVLIALIVLESFMDKVCRLMRADVQPATAARERAIEALMRCLRVAILLLSLSLLFRIWAVHGVGMMEMSRYNALAGAALPAGAILLGAYCAWQAVEYFTTVHSAKVAIIMPGQEDPDGHGDAPASRMSTLMPLLRVTLMLAIVVMAGLTVLSQLGIDIMPLIAGASIIGLAISFGSQTLVKDIVSGVFYLVDDAFRVGEYIDCGRAKGTVEGFTLRSLKLRHQNGMIHTIPFGQLGQVTNFSRDWATLKFNLRFTRDTDIEKLRKTVKKIGLEMLEDPDLKDDFLMPLKMQGVADITDNALVVRFKFTVKPTRPTVIQREAVKRMIRILPEQGIEFANNMVSVQALGGPAGTEQAAAAITRTQIANDLAQRTAVEAAATG